MVSFACLYLKFRFFKIESFVEYFLMLKLNYPTYPLYLFLTKGGSSAKLEV